MKSTTNSIPVLNVETWSGPIAPEKKCEEKSRFATVRRNQITISCSSIAYIFILFCVVSRCRRRCRRCCRSNIASAIHPLTRCSSYHVLYWATSVLHPWCTRDAHTIPHLSRHCKRSWIYFLGEDFCQITISSFLFRFKHIRFRHFHTSDHFL